ncbi:PilN domain-containing protein [Sedimenticola sp.]|uniref:PilN domain-containing protein n=1 Tax=Sedimenticola sp. TaxID=1940285 RepID=UPI003D13E8AB
MRKQQINLYQPLFRKQPAAFSFNTLLKTVLLSVSAMAALSGLGAWQGAQLNDQLKSAEARRDKLQDGLTQMAERLPKPTVNKMLESERQQLTEKRKAGLSVLTMLKSRLSANQTGFSSVFEGLARQSFPELWFTHIEITQAGDFLLLKGKSLQPEWVPLLLKNLQQEPAFAGKSFQVVEMVREDDLAQALDFSLMTASRSVEP